MFFGVSKSGSPIWRWMTERPWASSALARASTSNAVSVPRRLIADASLMAKGTTPLRYRDSCWAADRAVLEARRGHCLRVVQIPPVYEDGTPHRAADARHVQVLELVPLRD